jgi:hypothetical protein
MSRRLIAAFVVVAILALGTGVLFKSGLGLPGAASSAGPSDLRLDVSAPVAAPESVVGFSALTASDAKGQARIAENPQLIVWTGNLSLEVQDLDARLIEAERLISGLGGRISSSQRQSDQPPGGPIPLDQNGLNEKPGSGSSAVVTYRIPAAQFQAAVAALSRLGKVLVSSTSSNEVTGQVRDLEAALRNQQVTETALLGIMAQATKISDILAVQEQLTNVRGQIEQLTAQTKDLRAQAAEGTLTVTFSLPFVAVTQQTKGWDLGQQVDSAAAALLGLAQDVASVAVWLAIVGLPILLVGLLLIGLPALLIRRRRRPAQV